MNSVLSVKQPIIQSELLSTAVLNPERGYMQEIKINSIWYLPTGRLKVLLVHKDKVIKHSEHRRVSVIEVLCKSSEESERR